MPAQVWDPEWFFAHNVTAQENELVIDRVKELIVQHLGKELAGSPEMVEYVATLITTHKKMSDVLFSIAEVLDEDVPDAHYESSVTFSFAQQLFSLAKQLAATFAPIPKAAPAPSRLFSAAVAGVKASTQAPKSDTVAAGFEAHPSSSAAQDRSAEPKARKRPHAEVESEQKSPRKIVVVKRSHEDSPGQASRHSHGQSSKEHSLPEYGRPGTAQVVREEANEYSGVSRPAVRQIPADGAASAPDSGEQAIADTGAHVRGGGFAGRGTGRGGNLPTQEQIQMALAIVSQMAAVGGLGGSAVATRGGFAGRGRGVGRGRGGHYPMAHRDTKWVNQSSVPCKFGDACRNNPCPFGHAERQAASEQSSGAGGGSAASARPVEDILPRKSSKFGASAASSS